MGNYYGGLFVGFVVGGGTYFAWNFRGEYIIIPVDRKRE